MRNIMARLMSAFGPKRTSLVAPHMSAFGGKADMIFCEGPLSRSLLGAKRTSLFALHMSAFDLKRTYWFDQALAILLCAKRFRPEGRKVTACGRLWTGLRS